MHYQQVCLEALAYTLPDERVSSDEIEARLGPLYNRLRLPAGRLELMTGIRERRFWPVGTLPSSQSIESCERVLACAGIDRGHVGALVHASVCRDHLEPATACRVHHGLGLPPQCQIFDVSNACLGILNGMLAVGNMIELGQIRAGLVVGSEGSRQLVETTIDWLNRDLSLSRDDIKLAVASLTIGSASCAVLLVDRRLSRTQNRILAATARATHPIPRSVPQRSGRSRGRRHESSDADRCRAVARGRHRDRRRDVCKFSGRRGLGPRPDRQDVLPSGRREPSQADARRAALDPCAISPRWSSWATPARSPCRSRWPWPPNRAR